MPVASNLLTARQVEKAKKPGMYADGGNLYLQVTGRADGTTSKSWIFRYVSPIEVYGPTVKDPKTGKERPTAPHRVGKPKVRDMGIGTYPRKSLAEAREKAKEAYKLVERGIDPIRQRLADKATVRLAAAKALTFAECAQKYIEAKRGGWKSPIHARQWENTLLATTVRKGGKTVPGLVAPIIGKLPVASIDMDLVLRVIEPIWEKMPETASRVRGRIETVLGWATVRKYREGDNPARWHGLLEHQLPAKANIYRVEHFAALDYRDIPAFMADLRDRDSMSARALEFTILTAARTGETIRAIRDGEIDFAAKAWEIPAERMKADKPHRVPLSARALEIIRDLPVVDGNPHLFPGTKPKLGLSEQAMAHMLKSMEWTNRADQTVTVHGMRATFKTWAADRTSYPRDLIEACMAHTLGSKVEEAYMRGTMFEKRRRLMEDWAAYCASPADADTDNVVAIGARS